MVPCCLNLMAPGSGLLVTLLCDTRQVFVGKECEPDTSVAGEEERAGGDGRTGDGLYCCCCWAAGPGLENK